MKNKNETAKQMTITGIFAAREIDPGVVDVSPSVSKSFSEDDLSEAQEAKLSENSSSAKLAVAISSSGGSMQETMLDFETALAELEQVVAELDSEVKLERALALFEQGMRLSIECEKFLKSAEQRVEILKQTLDGTIITEPFKTPLLDTTEG